MTIGSSRGAPVIIVGAGLSGLACAITLNNAQVPFLLLDRSEKVGGRVQTDQIGGYRLDRGFQVLLTAYREAQNFLDFEELDLQACYPGSKVWYRGHFHQVSDPFRHPWAGVKSLVTPIGSLGDKLRVGLLRMGFLSAKTMPDHVSTIEALRKWGFGPSMIERFWVPFMRGVFLENELSTSVRKFEETFRFFSKGDSVLPRKGIGEIPAQLASRLPSTSMILGKDISHAQVNKVQAVTGEVWEGTAVVLATEREQAVKLLGGHSDKAEWNAVDCLYFSLPRTFLPCADPILYLDGSGEGPVNNLTFISNISDCAPDGQALVSMSVIGRKDQSIGKITEDARSQVRKWFGESVKHWNFLHAYRIPYAVPSCPSPLKPEPLVTGVYRCGDYIGLPSIDAAMRSGRETAESIIKAHFS